jgi:hypothetical protein
MHWESPINMSLPFDANKVLDELLSRGETTPADIVSAVQGRAFVKAAAAGAVSSVPRESSHTDDLKVETAYKLFKLRAPR